MRPNCYNRPPYAEGYWRQTGLRVVAVKDKYPFNRKLKPVFRWFPTRFENRCVIHDGRGIWPNGENYPDAHGWDCTGCRWNPRMVVMDKASMVGKSESAVRFFHASGDINFLPDDGERWRIVEVDSINNIDAFEPIHRSIAK